MTTASALGEGDSSRSCANPKVERGSGDDDLRVRDVMVARPKTIPADGTVADLRRLFANPHVATALLVDGALFAGAIDREQLPRDTPEELPARDVARDDVDVIDPDTPMASALARMDASGQHRLVVLDRDGRTLRGLLCLTPDRTGFCQGTPEPTATGHRQEP